jgi:hypothetical protein
MTDSKKLLRSLSFDIDDLNQKLSLYSKKYGSVEQQELFQSKDGTYEYVSHSESYSPFLKSLLKKVSIYEEFMSSQITKNIWSPIISLSIHKNIAPLFRHIGHGWFQAILLRTERERKNLPDIFIAKIEFLKTQIDFVDFVFGDGNGHGKDGGIAFQKNFDACRIRDSDFQTQNDLKIWNSYQSYRMNGEEEVLPKEMKYKIHEIIGILIQTIWASTHDILYLKNSDDITLKENINSLKEEFDSFKIEYYQIQSKEIRIAICYYFIGKIEKIIENTLLFDFIKKSILNDITLVQYLWIRE